MAAEKERRPIAGIEELTGFFEAGCKPISLLRIGVEHEKIGVVSGGAAPGYEPLRLLLEQMAQQKAKNRPSPP